MSRSPDQPGLDRDLELEAICQWTVMRRLECLRLAAQYDGQPADIIANAARFEAYIFAHLVPSESGQ